MLEARRGHLRCQLAVKEEVAHDQKKAYISKTPGSLHQNVLLSVPVRMKKHTQRGSMHFEKEDLILKGVTTAARCSTRSNMQLTECDVKTLCGNTNDWNN